ncbi:MAG TPA: tryptophan--tRNA ligase, partial [Thermoplasmata archaeon]|nr:tryptophan--tRNA ligase [Thermoplasmata archaeon]
KIMDAFTGGRATVEEQRRLGANPYICSIFAFYNYVFEPYDGHLSEVERTCKSGERLCGDCKLELWGKVEAFLKKHHEAREKAKDRIEDFLLRD